jgi:hypothetical protein
MSRLFIFLYAKRYHEKKTTELEFLGIKKYKIGRFIVGPILSIGILFSKMEIHQQKVQIEGNF